MGENCPDHRAGQQSSTNRRASRGDKQNGANDFQSTSEIAKPLADPDRRKELNPEGFTRIEFGCSKIQECQSHQDLENPEREVEHSTPKWAFDAHVDGVKR